MAGVWKQDGVPVRDDKWVRLMRNGSRLEARRCTAERCHLGMADAKRQLLRARRYTAGRNQMSMADVKISDNE